METSNEKQVAIKKDAPLPSQYCLKMMHMQVLKM
jgi:hypothetical protein